MSRPVAHALLAALLIGVGAVGACSADDDGTATTSSHADPTSTTEAPSTTVAVDDALTALLLEQGDLPEGFSESDDVDDTITAFCATEDAAAGLRANGRAVRGFTRTPSGASVIQLAFRFEDDGAATFVEQAGAVLDRCSGVPDASGLAFEYAPLAAPVEAAVAGAGDARVGRYGVSVGSGSLSIDVLVVQHGTVGQLVAVLGLDLPREELDALATRAFTAAVTKAAALA